MRLFLEIFFCQKQTWQYKFRFKKKYVSFDVGECDKPKTVLKRLLL